MGRQPPRELSRKGQAVIEDIKSAKKAALYISQVILSGKKTFSPAEKD